MNHHDLHGVGSLHRVLFHYNVVGSETWKQPKQAQEFPRSKVPLKWTAETNQSGTAAWTREPTVPERSFRQVFKQKNHNICAATLTFFTNQDLEITSFPDVVHLYH